MPFSFGVIFLFTVIIIKYLKWFIGLESSSKRDFVKALFSKATIKAIVRIFRESLVHVSIFKSNPLLGYMHCSLAFGWFLLIVVGFFDSYHLNGGGSSPLFVHIFSRYFYPGPATDFFSHIFSWSMDLILLFILSGVALAFYKRFRSKSMGMKKTTKHNLLDKISLISLWTIFPARLFAESVTCGIYGSGGFLTHSFGEFLSHFLPLQTLEMPFWWLYSTSLGVFFVTLPFSRYMHIFTEIPHIILKEYGIRPKDEKSSVDNFQIESCSRCGLCIDPCQLQSDLNINTVQSVYYLRSRRYCKDDQKIVNNCLMCGRCSVTCPVGIDLNPLRLNSRVAMFDKIEPNRFDYLNAYKPKENSKSSKIAYFAGCMTLLTPAVMVSMKKIFNATGDDVWYPDEHGGVCCGRPLKLSGEKSSAQKLMDFNKKLFMDNHIDTIVTSCPICLKVFKEDYKMEGVEVIHHTEFILRAIKEGKIVLNMGSGIYTYHDPCELGRGADIYEAPREIIKALGTLVEAKQNREHSLCCGYSLANNTIDYESKQTITLSTSKVFENTSADILITSCPLCKVAFKNLSKLSVKDISESVAEHLRYT